MRLHLLLALHLATAACFFTAVPSRGALAVAPRTSQPVLSTDGNLWNGLGQERAAFNEARAELTDQLAESTRTANLAQLKARVLAKAAVLERGLAADEAAADEMERLVRQLEQQNPNPRPLAEAPELLSGRWTLAYTTSDSILGRNSKFLRPNADTPIVQTLDVAARTARNDDTCRFLGLVNVNRFVLADLEPTSPSNAVVRFRRFGLGRRFGLRVKAPERAVGELDTTYLDEALRVSRGDKGNLFILTKD